ncbi:MAG: InlB B-repeat-containing protein [Fibrobacter sp.]|uniref:InlB B-repeat-containing protein n=1 Tax=Fibrobacter sp. TaxID=35828 RepID=UPI0025C50B3E|nr:InlB B-repeat-containing protein [Fibrobacter sp.]MBQ3714279.1 InlB B-repeat-containing protein [Fibrobacter sp.]MBQ7081870.1 InlB B-repeat-containing protein [Fibrobacter sp.]
MKENKFFKGFYTALLFLVVGTYAAITPTLPSTNADGCYLISTPQELYGFAAIVNGSDGMSKNTKACGKLINDIIVNENTFVAVDSCCRSGLTSWTSLIKFEGSFDGNGHTISGLYQYFYGNASDTYIGFVWKSAGNAVIKNLIIKESIFSARESTVGGLVTEVTEGSTLSIENTHVDARVIGGYTIGGLIAEAYGSVVIDGTSFVGEFTSAFFVGGLIGRVRDNSEVSITNSHTNAKFANQDYQNAGGIVGSVYGKITIKKSYADGTVEGRSGAAGLIGETTGRTFISESYNVATVNGGGRAAGLVGHFGGDTLIIANSYNVGSLNSTGRVGGLVGTYDDTPILRGKMALIANSYNMGEIKGRNDLTRGIVVANTGDYLTIENCFYSTGVTSPNGGFEITDEFIQNGSLAKMLHTYHTGAIDGSVWGQEIGKDDHPIFSGVIKNAKEGIFHKLSFVSFKNDKTDYPKQYQEGIAMDFPKITDSSYIYAWYDNPEFTGEKYSNIPVSAKGDLTLYAKLIKVAEPPMDSDNCYLISDMVSLYSFASIVNGTNGMIQNNSACAKLTADIIVNKNVLDADGTVRLADTSNFFPWTPMDNFGGKFDGQGHVISGIYLNEILRFSAGLFDRMEGPVTIKNLGFVDSYIKGNSNVGGLVGTVIYNNKDTEIINCYNSSHVVSVNSVAGGFVGYSSHNKLHISESYNSGVVEGMSIVGGLVGQSRATIDVSDSYNTGTIRGDAAGGIIGSSGGWISRCYNVGAIEGSGVSAGIIGYVENIYISESYNKGIVGVNDLALASSSRDWYYAGGLVGLTGNDNTLTIVNSYNVGDVNAGDKTGGGLVGYLYSGVQMTAINSYNAGKITASIGKFKHGGILGESYSQNDVVIDNSYYLKGDSCRYGGIVFDNSELADGTLYKKLHEYAKDEIFGTVWKQNVGEDAYPVLMGRAYKLEFMVSTTVVKTVMVYNGTKLALVELPERAGFKYEPIDLPEFMPEHDLIIYGKFKKPEDSSSSVSSSSSVTTSSSASSSFVTSSSSVITSSAESSSSSAKTSSSSHSSAKSSSSKTKKSSSSIKKDAVVVAHESRFAMIVEGRRLIIRNVVPGNDFAIMDMQGRVVLADNVSQSQFKVELQTAGGYIVRIGQSMRRVNIK